MSGNNNRRKRPNNQANKKINDVKQDVKNTADDIKEEIKDNAKESLDKAIEKAPETAKEPIKKDNPPPQKPAVSSKQPTQPKHTETNSNKNSQATPKNKITDKASEQKTVSPKASENKSTEKNITKTQSTQPSPAPTTEQKKGGLLSSLALIAGVAGTGLGVYNIDQVRKLNTGDQTAALATQLKSIEAKVSELGGKNTDEVASQLKAQLAEINKTLKASEAKANQRMSAIEQTQNGLTKTLQGDVKATLDQRLNEVNDLLSKVDQIELTQKSISQNLNQAVAVGEAVTAEGMAKQEVGYLLRMADYKIQSEGDAAGAAGLLEIAEKKMLLLNQGKTDKMVDNIRQKYIQLQGVKPIDSNALISSLKSLSDIVPNLMPKPNDSKPVKVGESQSEDAGSLLTQVGSIIASGIEYTPNDPSKIDISAETVLIEKRLMQADIRTAELAVRSQNGVLLAETINSIRANLDKYFAADDTAKTIESTLANIEKQKLETVLPDLGPLVKQYEDR